ncbi:MAG: Tat pathway signal protein, partial [Variovorax sp.]|nr:Tat pathway signal protein [Variovorax sp.]
MHYIDPKGHSRRAFLKRSSSLALAGTAMPFALNLATMGEAAAQTATDYKALVCVFLYGGCDYANTVVTYDDDSYGKYSTIRGGVQSAGGIAIAKADLAATALSPTTPLSGNRQYALH